MIYSATVYKTWSAGAGPTVGVHYGLTGGIIVGVAADEMSGHGLNFGVHAVIPAIPGVVAMNLSGEINTSFSADYEFLGLGICAGVPIAPLLSNGMSFGGYLDYSNMEVVKTGNAKEMINYFWNEANRLKDAGKAAEQRARQINTSNGVYWGVKKDTPW